MHFIRESKQIVLWGYSFLGRRVERFLESRGIQIDVYWDSNLSQLSSVNKKAKVFYPGDGAVLPEAKIIVCIGNNLLRDNLIKQMRGKGFENFLSEDELHILFAQVLNNEWEFHSECRANMSMRERLEAAILSAAEDNFRTYERQLEYMERVRMASKVVLLGSYNSAAFGQMHLMERNGVKNIIGYVDGNNSGKSDIIKHLQMTDLNEECVCVAMQQKFLDYLPDKVQWHCMFGELMQNVFTEHHEGAFFREEKDAILSVYDMLEDDISKEVYVETICNRIAPQYATKSFEDMEDGQGYFDHGLFDMREDESYVDGGAYDGDSVIEFIEQVQGKYAKIYAFELDKDNYDIMCRNLEQFESGKIETYCMGLYNRENRISLGGHADGTHISGWVGDGENDYAQVAALDDVLAGKPVTLIKMDIEGSEMPALNGAKKIITEQKPRIAISAYHKLEDIWQIPIYLKSLNPKYRCYLRHHGPVVWDTDLYFTE